MSRRRGDDHGLVTVNTGQKITFNQPEPPEPQDRCACDGTCPTCGKQRGSA